MKLTTLGDQRKRSEPRKSKLEPKKAAVPLLPTTLGYGKRLESLTLTNQFVESLPKFKIDTVSFSFMGDALVRRLSVVQCSSAEFSGTFSVNSDQMGTINRNQSCGRCSQMDIECSGHIGRIELAVSFPHPLAVENIIYVLRSVCSNCGKLLLPQHMRNDPSILRLHGIARLKKISQISQGNQTTIIMCPKNLEIMNNTTPMQELGDPKLHDRLCPVLAPRYCTFTDKEQWQVFAMVAVDDEDKQKKMIRIPITRVRSIFDSISQEDLLTLGFVGRAHPSNFILSVLPVLPERCRPPVDRDGERKQDHITILYTAIIRENKKLRELLEKKAIMEAGMSANPSIKTLPAFVSLENLILASTRQLYFQVSHLFNNSDGKYKLRLGDSASTMTDRITGKEGFCRAVSQGKRVNFCARTVISPSLIPFGSLVIPSVMQSLSVPERANMFNISKLQEYLSDGKVVFMTRASGNERGLTLRVPASSEARAKRGITTINIGDVVERIAMNGDEMTVNRQPTLHRHSMIGVRALFKPERKTLGLHCSYTSPLNADFDGDESSIYVHQTLTSRAEVRGLLGAPNQIVSAANSFPVMSLVYNAPTSAYLLSTDPQVTIEEKTWKQVVSNLLVDTSRAESLEERLLSLGQPLRTPRAVLSLALPEDFFFITTYNPDEGGEIKVVIQKGCLVEGVLTHAVLGRIVHAIYRNYNQKTAGRFITEGQALLEWYIEYRGFSIGVADCVIRNVGKVRKVIEGEIESIRAKVEALQGEGPEGMTSLERQHQSAEISKILGGIRNFGVRVAKEGLSPSNPLLVMVTSGAKGNITNIARIAGAIGQCFVDDGIPKRSVYPNRSLVYFDAEDYSIESNGFVKSSFSDGMKPSELVYHMEASRIGLLDTALRTADIGNLAHKTSKILENLFVGYMYSVTNTGGSYVSLSYGEGYMCEFLINVTSFKSTGPVFMPFNLKTLADELNLEAITSQ